MGRAPCCEKVGLKKGRWTAEEDNILTNYIQANGEGSWRSLPKKAGLLRCGKSCRLRWINYLRTDLKRGNISAEEDETIIKLHNSLGNRWSLIADQLPGRTDNEIKNYWNSHLSRRIHTSRRLNGDEVHVMVDIGKYLRPKRRGARASKSSTNNITANGGGGGNARPTLEKEVLQSDAIVEQSESENMALTPSPRKATVALGEVKESGDLLCCTLAFEDGRKGDILELDSQHFSYNIHEMECDHFMCTNEERESGALLGTNKERESGVLEKGTAADEERRSGGLPEGATDEKRESGGVLKGVTEDTGNGVNVQVATADEERETDWCTPSGFFQEDWMHWDLDREEEAKLKGETGSGEEKWSWLWEGDHVEDYLDCEVKSYAAWLLSADTNTW